MTGPLLTQKQVAERFGITIETLRKWRYAGRIGYLALGHRTIRIPESEVERLLQFAVHRGLELEARQSGTPGRGRREGRLRPQWRGEA